MEKKRLHYKVTEECLTKIPIEDSGVDFKKHCSKKQKNTFLAIIKDENGTGHLFNMYPIEIDGSYYGVVYPDPIEMLIEQSELFYKMSSCVLPTFMRRNTSESCAPFNGEKFSFVDDKVSKQIIAYRVSSLTLSIMALESFLNSNIPHDYTTKTKKGEVIDKSKIELTFSIKEKLTEFKTIYDINNQHYQDCISNIQRMVELRNDFVHIKSIPNPKNVMSDGLVKSYETIMNADLSKLIIDIQYVIKTIKDKQ